MAAQRGALCFGPNRGRKTTYSSPRRWMNGFEPVDADSALRWLVTSYLAAYGPATPAHFAAAQTASSDVFLYVRCVVVAAGRKAYDRVLRKPAA